MRIAIYDGILETHLGDSLASELRRRGHTVLNTGRFGAGFHFPEAPEQLARIDEQVDRVIDFRADMVVVMRPASLPIERLKRLKRHVAHLYAWFCDDPVLFDLSYGAVVDEYDAILHCGTDRVLEFYSRRFGRATGVNFPFWTSSDYFPRVYGQRAPESDLLFLGNAQGDLRRRRYHDLSKLRHGVRIHGRAGVDFRSINGGYLDGEQEVVLAGAAARAAVNIPQYFSDHEGMETWFDALPSLGHFQYPSRVIQYAALGLPIFNVGVSDQDQRTFPELINVASVADIDSAMAGLDDVALADLSARTHRRFLRHFSATSRAMALESLAEDDSWRELDVAERTDWFSRFDALTEPVTTPQDGSRDPQPITLVPARGITDVILDVAIVRERADLDDISRTAAMGRELEGMGHRVRVISSAEARRLGALSDSEVGTKLRPSLLWRNGDRFDVVVVALNSRPSVGTEAIPTSAKLVWCDEFEASETPDPTDRNTGFDLIVHTDDARGRSGEGLYLPPLVDRRFAGVLRRIARPQVVDPWYLSAPNPASVRYYPEVVDEATLILGAALENTSLSMDVRTASNKLARHGGAILLPSRRAGRSRLHPLFAAFIATGRPVLHGRISAPDVGGIGSNWMMVRDASETVRKAHSARRLLGASAGASLEGASVVAGLLSRLGLPSAMSRRPLLARARADSGSVTLVLEAAALPPGARLALTDTSTASPIRGALEEVRGGAVVLADSELSVEAVTAAEIVVRLRTSAGSVTAELR